MIDQRGYPALKHPRSRAAELVRGWLSEAPWLVMVIGLFPSAIVAAAALRTLPPLPVRTDPVARCVAEVSTACQVACDARAAAAPTRKAAATRAPRRS